MVTASAADRTMVKAVAFSDLRRARLLFRGAFGHAGPDKFSPEKGARLGFQNSVETYSKLAPKTMDDLSQRAIKLVMRCLENPRRSRGTSKANPRWHALRPLSIADYRRGIKIRPYSTRGPCGHTYSEGGSQQSLEEPILAR